MRPYAALLAGVFALAFTPESTYAQNATTVIDNDSVHVVRTVQAPHQKQRWPQQDVNCLAIYLQSGSQEIVSSDRGKTTITFEAGDVRWIPASGAYTTELVSDAPVTQVLIFVVKKENEGGPNASPVVTPPGIDPIKAAPSQFSLLLQNKRVRVMSLKLPVADATPAHEHPAGSVLVYLTDASVNPGGKETIRHQAGDVTWIPPVRQVLRNMGTQPLDGIVVEVK